MKSLYEFLNERKTIEVKRKYAHHDPIAVGSNAPVRQKILGFISENGSCSKDSLVEFIKTTNEESGSNTNTNWLTKNCKYIVEFEKDGAKHYKLSKLGQRVVSRTNINESSYLGKTIGKNLSIVDFGKRVTGIDDIKVGDSIILYDHEIDKWIGNNVLFAIHNSYYKFNNTNGKDLEISKSDIEDDIRNIGIFLMK